MTRERRTQTLSVAELCATYDLSPTAVYRLIDRRQLRVRKVGGRRRILMASAVKLLSSPVNLEYLRLVKELQNVFSSIRLHRVDADVEKYRRIKVLLVLISLELHTWEKPATLTDLTTWVLASAEELLSRPESAEYSRLVQALRDLYSSSAGNVERYRRGKELLELISIELNCCY
jgi:hypothetical protein